MCLIRFASDINLNLDPMCLFSQVQLSSNDEPRSWMNHSWRLTDNQPVAYSLTAYFHSFVRYQLMLCCWSNDESRSGASKPFTKKDFQLWLHNILPLLYRYQLMLRCWSRDMHRRPTFNQIVKELQQILTKSTLKKNTSNKTEDYYIEPMYRNVWTQNEGRTLNELCTYKRGENRRILWTWRLWNEFNILRTAKRKILKKNTSNKNRGLLHWTHVPQRVKA